MKIWLGVLTILVLLGMYLGYNEMNNMKADYNGADSSQKTVVSNMGTTLESLRTDVAGKLSQNQAATNDQAKVLELEKKLTDMDTAHMAKIKELEDALAKKADAGSCDMFSKQCMPKPPVKKQQAVQSVKQWTKTTTTTKQTVEKKSECRNKAEAVTCVQEKLEIWKLSCKIKTTPEEITTSFASREKVYNKNLKTVKEITVVKLKPEEIQLPDLNACLKSKEEIVRECDKLHCL